MNTPTVLAGGLADNVRWELINKVRVPNCEA